MNAAFNRAAIPQPFRILGVSLKPFSIGHEILLQSAQNAFAKDSTSEPQFADLVLAVRICRLDYDSAIQDIVRGNRLFNAWLWMLKHSSVVPALEVLKFKAYLSHYRTGPDFTQKSDVSRSATGTPFEYALKVFLCTKMGFTREMALNYPYCAAVADFIAYLETKGAVHVVDSLEELEREGREAQAEIIERSKAWL